MPDESELQRLYDEHANGLFAFLLNFTRDENDTRDLLQEIFTKLARQSGLLRGARNERSFLIRLAHNAAIDLMRRRGAREKYHEGFGSEPEKIFAAANDPDEQSFRDELSRALAELPPDQRAGFCRAPGADGGVEFTKGRIESANRPAGGRRRATPRESGASAQRAAPRRGLRRISDRAAGEPHSLNQIL